MSSKNVLELILSGNSSKLLNALGIGEKGLRKFGHTAKQEFDRIRSAATSVEGKLASLGMSIGAGMLVKQSAQMDKVLTQIGQTAGATKGEVQGLRKELFRMSSETGQSVEDLQQGFNNAVQAGLNFKEALPVIEATNKAMAVTGANADRLTSGLTVAATAFQFDLSKPSLALSLLDKMTTAGRLGNAELQNLSDIFARVGVNASRAGMGFDQTLAFIEGSASVWTPITLMRGLTSFSTSKPRPRRSRPPGRIASTTASASRTRSRNTVRPSSVRRSSVIDRFPRLMWRCISEVPSTIGHVILRM